jgi:hypothetical protein
MTDNIMAKKGKRTNNDLHNITHKHDIIACSPEAQVKYHTSWRFPESNIKKVERGKIDTPSTQIHDHSLSCLETGTSQNVVGLDYQRRLKLNEFK